MPGHKVQHGHCQEIVWQCRNRNFISWSKWKILDSNQLSLVWMEIAWITFSCHTWPKWKLL